MFGLIIPEEHGGMGLGNMAYSRTLQEVGRYDASVAVTIGAHSSIGMRGLLLFGSDEQKSRYMPQLASGELVAAFCLTEPGAGSDAAAVKDHCRTTGRPLGPQWQQAVDHQRRIRGLFHRVCPHRGGKRARQNDRFYRHQRHGGRQHRPA